MSEYMDKLIHVGFTNKYQLDYANDAEGAFYCDSDNECNIPLYMLSVHSMRANDSVVIETHDKLTAQVAELRAALETIKHHQQSVVPSGFEFSSAWQIADKALKDCEL